MVFIDCFHFSISYWLVVSTPLKNISQLGWLFPIYGKIKNVPNHQPVPCLLVYPVAEVWTTSQDSTVESSDALPRHRCHRQLLPPFDSQTLRRADHASLPAAGARNGCFNGNGKRGGSSNIQCFRFSFQGILWKFAWKRVEWLKTEKLHFTWNMGICRRTHAHTLTHNQYVRYVCNLPVPPWGTSLMPLLQSAFLSILEDFIQQCMYIFCLKRHLFHFNNHQDFRFQRIPPNSPPSIRGTASPASGHLPPKVTATASARQATGGRRRGKRGQSMTKSALKNSAAEPNSRWGEDFCPENAMQVG